MIFVIGIHKTGLTSLSHAMRELGLEGWQYPHPNNVSMLRMGRVKIDFGCDCPFMYDYRKWGAMFPNSKFIVTTREDEKEWISSNRAQQEKRRFPYYRDIYTMGLWGQLEFTDEHMLKVKEKHYSGIAEYFKGRPQDVLYMNVIEHGDGWDKLCPFIGKDIPNTPFPHRNKRDD